MCVCWSWLCVDFFVRNGFALEQSRDGERWAVKSELRLEIPRYCGHVDCPPHVAALMNDRAA